MEILSIDFRKTVRLAGRMMTLVCLAGPVICQTQIDLRTQSRNIDFTAAVSTKPFKSGASLPALCAAAEVFFNLNAPPGQNLYVCTALNTWTAARAAAGITTLNGIAALSQNFTNDANITITSSGSSHAIGWSGTLAKLRQNPASVYNDQGNIYAGPFSQDFSGIAHLRVPVAPGYTPNAIGHFGYDSATNVYKGFNGAVKTLAFTDSNITGNAATATAFAAAPLKCAAGNYPLGVDALGNAVNCTAAGTGNGSSTGISLLNGLASSSQSFTNDTNVTVVSLSSTHTITWSGTLAKTRQNAATVYTDQGNIYSGAFVQDFSGIAHLRLPVAAGYTPTISGHFGYDSTAKLYKGYNGTAVKTFAFTDSNITGNAATASAFASIPSKCTAGTFPLGIDASGNAQNCTAAGSGSGTGDSSGQTIVPFSATPAYSITKNTFEAQKLTLTANVTSSTLSVASGTPLIQLSVCQDGIGSRTNVWPSNVIGAPVISADASSCTNVSGPYDGTNMQVTSSSVIGSNAAPALVYQIGGVTYTQLLPAANGTLSDAGAGSGTVSILSEQWFPFGVCNSSGQIFPQVNTPADSSGVLACFNDGIIATAPPTGTHPITFGFHLPGTWTSSTAINMSFSWFDNSSGDPTKVIGWNGAIKCMNESGGILGSTGVMTFPTALANYNTPVSSSTNLLSTQVLIKTSLNALTATGCNAGGLVFARLERDNTVASNSTAAVRIAQGIAITYTRTNQ